MQKQINPRFSAPPAGRRCSLFLSCGVFGPVLLLGALALFTRPEALGQASPAPSPAPPASSAPAPKLAAPISPHAGHGALLSATPSPDEPFVVPDPVATVNGEPISRAELERVTTALLGANGRTPEELTNAEKKRFYHAVVEGMITDKLVARQAASIKVTDAEVDKRFEELKTQVPAEQIEAELKRTGQTPAQLKANIRASIQQEQWMIGKLGGEGIKAPDAEVEAYFKEHPEEFQAPETVRASHILLRVNSDASPEIAAEKEKLAQSLLERLKKGETFAELAKSFSDDPDSKEKGGDLGFFSRDRIVPELADAAFLMKKDEASSAPVRSPFGWHLLKLTDRKAAHPVTLEESRDQIRAFLEANKKREAASKLIAELHEAAKIQNNLP
jgi:peptidyl-prolyl cis-trans isomerase C